MKQEGETQLHAEYETLEEKRINALPTKTLPLLKQQIHMQEEQEAINSNAAYEVKKTEKVLTFHTPI